MIGVNTAPASAICCWGDSLTSTSSTSSESSLTAGSYPNQMRQNNRGRPVIAKSYPSQAAQYVTARALEDSILRHWTAVYWGGTNNIATADAVATTLAAARQFVGNLSHDRYLILSPLTLYTFQTGHVYNIERQAMSDALNAEFTTRYVDVWAALLAAGPAGDAANGGSSVGTVHTSLRLDNLHLNDAGNNVVQGVVMAAITARGY